MIYILLLFLSQAPEISRVDNYINRVTEGCPKCEKRAQRAKPLIIKYCLLYNIDPLLGIMLAKFETSWIPTKVGLKGETTIYQVHGRARRRCKKQGLDLTTLEGQVDCGLQWLEKCYDACGSTVGALYMYGTGKCTSTNPKAIKRIERRLRIYIREAGR